MLFVAVSVFLGVLSVGLDHLEVVHVDEDANDGIKEAKADRNGSSAKSAIDDGDDTDKGHDEEEEDEEESHEVSETAVRAGEVLAGIFIVVHDHLQESEGDVANDEKEEPGGPNHSPVSSRNCAGEGRRAGDCVQGDQDTDDVGSDVRRNAAAAMLGVSLVCVFPMMHIN